MKLSQWHGGNIKPVHIGVYEGYARNGTWYRKWNGEFWLEGAEDINYADTSKSLSSYQEQYKWRGIVK